MIKNNRKTVYVGMSGGVDSSVSAALLKKADFDVVGVFIKVWKPEYIDCTWREDRLDAMRICAKLNIPFFTLDLENEYKRDVVDYMISEYKAGRTPNPDVMCNRYIKFGRFFDWAMKRGADYVATGHYARVARVADLRRLHADSRRINASKLLPQVVEQSSLRGKQATSYKLQAGVDGNKDQSYFLWTLTQRELSKTLFPIGHLEKPEVRKLADKFGLNTATKKDSQGLCFMGKIDVKDFLKNYIKEKEGKVLNEKGEMVGKHFGSLFFTLGERHGFEIIKKNSNDKPYYVIGKDLKKNELVVSQDKRLIEGEDSKQVLLNDVNIICDEIGENKIYQARIRYRQPLEECVIVKRGKVKGKSQEIELHFINPQKSVTPGQSAVIYDGDVCVAGGVIK